jgi:hypothetical protein
VFVAASVKNKQTLEPWITRMQKPREPGTGQEGSGKKGGGPLSGMKPSIQLTDSFVVVSLSPMAAEKFLRSNGDNEVTRFVSPYAGHSSLFSLDLKTLLGFAMQMSKKKPGDEQGAAKMLESLDKLVFYGGQYQNGAAHSAAELQFSNKQENSLKQFVNLAELAIGMGMKGKKSNPPGDENQPEDDEKENQDEPGEQK